MNSLFFIIILFSVGICFGEEVSTALPDSSGTTGQRSPSRPARGRELSPWIWAWGHFNGGISFRRTNADTAVSIKESPVVKRTLQAAKRARKEGQRTKAHKLINHTLSLDPSNADALNECGLILEDMHKSSSIDGALLKLKANIYYSRALASNSSHTQAGINRNRTCPVVERIYRATFAGLDEKVTLLRTRVKEIGQLPPLHELYLKTYKRTAQRRSATEEKCNICGETAQRISATEKQCHFGEGTVHSNSTEQELRGLKYIVDKCLPQGCSITQDDILQIVRCVMGYIVQLRESDVFAGNLAAPSANESAHMLDGFLDWLVSAEAAELHPIQRASRAHYYFVYIHPFDDGNGRTSRILMNLILMRAGFPPVFLRKSSTEKHRYYDAMKLADWGDIRPFVNFICKYLEDELERFLKVTFELKNRANCGVVEQSTSPTFHTCPPLVQNQVCDLLSFLFYRGKFCFLLEDSCWT